MSSEVRGLWITAVHSVPPEDAQVHGLWMTVVHSDAAGGGGGGSEPQGHMLQGLKTQGRL